MSGCHTLSDQQIQIKTLNFPNHTLYILHVTSKNFMGPTLKFKLRSKDFSKYRFYTEDHVHKQLHSLTSIGK